MLELLIAVSVIALGLTVAYLWAESVLPMSRRWYHVSMFLNLALILGSVVLCWQFWKVDSFSSRLASAVQFALAAGLTLIFAIKVLRFSSIVPLAPSKLFRRKLDFSYTALDSSAISKHVWRKETPFVVTTDDGVAISGLHIQSGHNKVIVIAHGAFRSKNTIPYALLAQWLAYDYDVVTFDFRGHGDSRGEFDFSEKTTLDLCAVLRFVHERKCYDKVGVFGRSMGAWTGLIVAGTTSGGCQFDSLIAAASPLRQITSLDAARKFRAIFYATLIGHLLRPFGRVAINIIRGTRVSAFCESRYCPVDVVGAITIPVLLIYQEFDSVIGTDVQDAQVMYRSLAHAQQKELLILAGSGHIFEVASFQKLYGAIHSWFGQTLVT